MRKKGWRHEATVGGGGGLAREKSGVVGQGKKKKNVEGGKWSRVKYLAVLQFVE